MNKVITISITLLLVFATQFYTYADNSNIYRRVVLHKSPTNRPPDCIENGPEGRRMPPRPIYCNISNDNGVEIPTLDCEIISYEVWDIEGNYCIASFSEETEFVEFVFSMTSNCTIKVITDGYVLCGFLFI